MSGKSRSDRNFGTACKSLSLSRYREVSIWFNSGKRDAVIGLCESIAADSSNSEGS